MNWEVLTEWQRRLVELGKEFAGSGPVHRRRLSNIPTRIAVSGVRGKSTAVRWLHEICYRRGHDTYAKVTGVEPISMYNDSEHEIDRPVKVRLYENERELRKFDPIDVAILENQGIREYTTRLVNQQFVRPDVVFITNIRKDHLDTLGTNQLEVARALARAVPADTHVVCGEQSTEIREYIDEILDRRDAAVTYVDVPDEHQSVPGAELAYGLNPVLRAVGEQPLADGELASFLARMSVSWTRLPDGRVYDAASANDIQSTEFIRRQLVGDGHETVQPLLYLRGDRRGRTASFYRYLEALAERNAIEQARVVGQGRTVFERRASFPVVTHDEHSETPGAVLDEALADGWPVVLIGNTVAEFSEGLTETIEHRKVNAIDQEFGCASSEIDASVQSNRLRPTQASGENFGP
jgi:hypothetical protein